MRGSRRLKFCGLWACLICPVSSAEDRIPVYLESEYQFESDAGDRMLLGPRYCNYVEPIT